MICALVLCILEIPLVEIIGKETFGEMFPFKLRLGLSVTISIGPGETAQQYRALIGESLG